MENFERMSNYDLQSILNKQIVQYESERIFAEKRGDAMRASIVENKRKEIEDIRNKLMSNEIIDNESKSKVRELVEKVKIKEKNSKKLIITVCITTILVVIITMILLKDKDRALWIGIMYFMIAISIGKVMVNSSVNSNKLKNKKDSDNPIQKI